MCPPPLHLILFSTHCWVTSRSSSLRRSILCAHSGPDFLNTGNYACQACFPLSGSFHLNPFLTGVVLCSSFKKNANVLSTLFLCLHHLCVSEPAAAVHRSASRALAHTLPAVFRCSWFLGLCNAVEMVPVIEQLQPQFSLDSEAILCREVAGDVVLRLLEMQQTVLLRFNN